MVLSRLLFFRRGLTTAVFRDFGKVPERSEAFTTSRRSASKQLNTLLKKDVGSVSRAQVDVLSDHFLRVVGPRCLEQPWQAFYERPLLGSAWAVGHRECCHWQHFEHLSRVTFPIAQSSAESRSLFSGNHGYIHNLRRFQFILAAGGRSVHI